MNPEQNQPESTEINETHSLEYLDKLGEITEEEISEFKNKLSKEKQKQFDNCDEEKQRIYTDFDRLSDEELTDLIKPVLNSEHPYLPGFHDVKKRMEEMTELTGNNRYADIANTIKH